MNLKSFLFGAIAAFILWASLVGAIIYVIVHFVKKFW